MGTFAERSIYSNDPSPQTGAGLAILADNQTAIRELPGALAPVRAEILDGAITPSSAFVIVDTEGQAAGDELLVINPVLSGTDSLHDGMIVYLQAADASRKITVEASSNVHGIMYLNGGSVTLGTTWWLALQLSNGVWKEVETGGDQLAKFLIGRVAALETPYWDLPLRFDLEDDGVCRTFLPAGATTATLVAVESNYDADADPEALGDPGIRVTVSPEFDANAAATALSVGSPVSMSTLSGRAVVFQATAAAQSVTAVAALVRVTGAAGAQS